MNDPAVRREHTASPFEARYGFCRGLRVGDRIEIAGTAPIPPDGSAPPEGAEAQAALCFAIAARAADALCDGWVPLRTRMYIVDEGDQDAVGRAHAAAFGAHPPVATMVVVKALLDPRWRVEIELEALATSSG